MRADAGAETAPRAQRRGGRQTRRATRRDVRETMLPGLVRGLPLVEPLDAGQIERIDAASMHILENVGVVFRDSVALEDWRGAGGDVRGERVHLDRGLVRELVATIPAGITYHARDPGKSVELGGRHTIFVPMTGARWMGAQRAPLQLVQ